MDDDHAGRALRFEHDQVFYRAAMDGLVLEGNAGVLKEIGAASGPKLVFLPRELDHARKLPLHVVREQLRPHGFRVVETAVTPTPDDITAAAQRAQGAAAVVVGTASRGGMTEGSRRMVEAVTSGDMPKVGVALLDPADADAMIQSTNCRIKTFGFTSPQLWALCQQFIT
jgi:hypothetical protein